MRQRSLYSVPVIFPKHPDATVVDEQFKPHPTYYWFWVSNYGRVWSLKSNRFVGSKHSYAYQGRNCERMFVHIPSATAISKKTQCQIGRLVLETFVGPRPSADHTVGHIAPNPLNNALSNLKWQLASENMSDHQSVNAEKTHCPKGHEYTKENIYAMPNKHGYSMRGCRVCRRDRNRAYHRARRAAMKNKKEDT